MTPVQMKDTIGLMADVVHKTTGYTMEDLQCRSRCYSLSSVRFIYAHFAKKLGMSLSEIGRCLNRTHSSVIYMLSKFDDDYSYSYSFRELANKIKIEIENAKKDCKSV